MPTSIAQGHALAMVIASPALKRFVQSLWAVFSLFIVYGTTVPFQFDLPGDIPSLLAEFRNFSLQETKMNASQITGDLVQNILLFLPFGVLGFLSMGSGLSNRSKVALVAGAGFSLSMTVEFLQLYSPVRHTSPVDVLTNTFGALAGAYIAFKTYKLISRFLLDPAMRRYFRARTAYPLAVFFLVTLAGAWMPFDFSMVQGDVVGVWQGMVRNFFDFAWPGDHGLIFVRYVIFSLALYRFLGDLGTTHPLLKGGLIAGTAAVILEACQILVVSRSPQMQDILTAWMGALAALALIKQRDWRAYPWVWAALWSGLIYFSAAMMSLYPFRPSEVFTGFNLVPFLAYGSRTGFLSLQHFMEMGLAFYPLGFLFSYLFRPSRQAMVTTVVVAGAMALSLEWTQGWFREVHADITDVIGAMAGAFLGHLSGGRGWRSYERLLEETEGSEVGNRNAI